MPIDGPNLEQRLRAMAPFNILQQAAFTIKQKVKGYRQFKYCWQDHGWTYEARFHEAVPGATLVTWPSWRLDRVKAGKGYGPPAHARVEQSLVAGHWLAANELRYCARLVQNKQANSEQAALLLAAHYYSKTDMNPGNNGC